MIQLYTFPNLFEAISSDNISRFVLVINMMLGNCDEDERPSEVERSCSLRRLSIRRDIKVDATLVAVQVSDVKFKVLRES